jgi:hypothetical protein
MIERYVRIGLHLYCGNKNNAILTYFNPLQAFLINTVTLSNTVGGKAR